MSGNLQQFLAEQAKIGAQELWEALERLPEDKRDWVAGGKARTALDMVAECAILNGFTAEIIISKKFNFDGAFFQKAKDELGQDLNALKTLLDENTAKVAEVIQNLPDDELKIGIDYPWGHSNVAETCAYPYWNMKYHTGQINFIASMLDCLD